MLHFENLTEKRKYQLSYCKICINRQSDLRTGLKCGLTNEIADFQEFCENYKIDSEELSVIQSQIDERIEQKYPKKNLVNWTLLGSYLDSKETIPAKKDKGKKVIGERTYLAYGIFLFFIIFLIYGLFLQFSGQLNHLSLIEKILGLGILLFLLIISGKSTFFPEQRQNIIFHEDFLEYNERKTMFRRNKVNKIYWREITNLRYHTQIINGMNYNIVIGTISKGILEINITDLETNPWEFIGLIKSRAENVAQHGV